LVHVRIEWLGSRVSFSGHLWEIARCRGGRVGFAAGSPLCLFMTTQQVQDLIVAEAARNGVSADLALAVARAESGFNPAARSGAGAQGVFQLMPATARAYGVADPFDPLQNVHAGVRMLADLSRQYRGDLPSMLAAYNWGSGNLASGRPLPAETQTYITRVYGFLGVPASAANPWLPRPNTTQKTGIRARLMRALIG
jgi:soluble lytic murein transglycosylase-like protein